MERWIREEIKYLKRSLVNSLCYGSKSKQCKYDVEVPIFYFIQSHSKVKEEGKKELGLSNVFCIPPTISDQEFSLGRNSFHLYTLNTKRGRQIPYHGTT